MHPLKGLRQRMSVKTIAVKENYLFFENSTTIMTIR